MASRLAVYSRLKYGTVFQFVKLFSFKAEVDKWWQELHKDDPYLWQNSPHIVLEGWASCENWPETLARAENSLLPIIPKELKIGSCTMLLSPPNGKNTFAGF